MPMCDGSIAGRQSGGPAKALGIIAARRNSERFSSKHHARILGKPMFAYALEAALRASIVDRLVVSSDDPEIATLARQYDVEFVERPRELAQATSAIDDAYRHVCDVLLNRDGFQPALVVGMQGNVPVRKEGQIDELIRHFDEQPGATAICTAQEVRFRPEWAKVIVDGSTGEAASYLSEDKGFRTQDYPELYVLDGAVCGVRRETLRATAGDRTTHAWLGNRLHLLVQDEPMYSLEIDYPDQLPLAEYYLERLAARALSP